MANQHGLGTIQNTLNISRGNLQATAAGGTNGKTKVLCLQSQNMLEPSCPSSFLETQSINLFWFKKVQKAYYSNTDKKARYENQIQKILKYWVSIKISKICHYFLVIKKDLHICQRPISKPL